MNDAANENNDAGNYRINNSKTTISKSFECKTKVRRKTPVNNNRSDTEVVVPLKYLKIFWRSPDLSLFNCEIELYLSWARICIISEISRTATVAANPPNPARAATRTDSETFHVFNPKLYVPVVTLSINIKIKFLENIKQRFKRTISWNKYRSEVTTQLKSNNLDYMIDPTFTNINGLLSFSFKNGNNDPRRDSFHKYQMLLVEIKDFNALINNKPFFDQSVKNKQETYEKCQMLKCQEMMTRQQKTY